MRSYAALVQSSRANLRLLFDDNPSERFNLCANLFFEFIRKDMSQVGEFDNHWKAHISIHPEDLPKAWDAIFPLLHAQAIKFKIINQALLPDALREQQTRLRQAEENVEEFIRSPCGHAELKRLAMQLSTERSEYTDIIREADETSHFYNLREFVHQKYQRTVTIAKQHVDEGARLSTGMQITIYMNPGSEQQYQQLLMTLEERLTTQHIRPGMIHHSDRALGRYCSIRHPGLAGYDSSCTLPME